MITTKQEVYEKLKELGVSFSVTEHKPVYTIEEMNELGMEKTENVIKNLFLRDDKKRNYYLVLLQKDKSISLKQLREMLGARPLSFASEEDLYLHLGLKKGSVTPMGILNDKEGMVKVIIDSEILSFDVIGVHPNENTATIWIQPKDLEKMLKDNGNEIQRFEF